jgi:4-amino-4-deoxy-L-arabinose transferase-like glycosyltransferase
MGRAIERGKSVPAGTTAVRRITALATSLTLILIVALALRAGYAWDYQQARPRQALAVLPFLFEPGNVAASLVQRGEFGSPFHQNTGPTAWLTPVYPLILAAIFRIFGLYTFPAFVAAAGLNIVFSTLTVVPLYYAGRRVGGVGAAALAAWLWALFPNAVKLPVESIWDSSLAALLAAAILWATLVLAGSRRWWAWCGYGLLWGLALMTTPALGSALPLLLVWLAWRSRRLAGPSLALGMAILCCVPWTIRNFVVFRSFIPLRSVIGLTLRMGNVDQSKAWPGRLHPIDNSAERDRYIELGEVAYMREKQQEALRFIAEHPGSEAEAVRSHIVALWAGGSARPLADFRATHSWSLRGVILFNLLVTGGTLAGVALLFWSGSVWAFPLTVFPAVFPLVYYLTEGTARYRHPIDPVLMLLTSVALCGVAGKHETTTAAGRT